MKATMEVEVTEIRKLTGDGKTRAMANVCFAGVVTIKGFSVVEGMNGVFVSGPRKAMKDGRWFDIIDLDENVKRAVEGRVLEAYDRETDKPR